MPAAVWTVLVVEAWAGAAAPAIVPASIAPASRAAGRAVEGMGNEGSFMRTSWGERGRGARSRGAAASAAEQPVPPHQQGIALVNAGDGTT
jgi:hypothetical protein